MSESLDEKRDIYYPIIGGIGFAGACCVLSLILGDHNYLAGIIGGTAFAGAGIARRKLSNRS